MKLLSQKHLMNSLRYSTLLRITAFLHAISDYAVKIVTLSPKGFVGHYIRKMMLAISLAFLFLALALSEVTLHLLSVRLPKFILNGVALKDLFAAGKGTKAWIQ